MSNPANSIQVIINAMAVDDCAWDFDGNQWCRRCKTRWTDAEKPHADNCPTLLARKLQRENSLLSSEAGCTIKYIDSLGVERSVNIPCKEGQISDGFHTFDELYDHRVILYIALCKNIDWIYRGIVQTPSPIWKSKLHSDGSGIKGWFVLGIHKDKGQQITYHLPNDKWDACEFAETLERAPEWDGHSSDEVLNRLRHLYA